MRKNNKGYSLVELLITMAIFSIIMIAIILIMRTSLVSYKDGLFETTMQEEAQIVANQVSDLLVDARYITSTGSTNSDGDLTYGFKSAEGIYFTLTFEGNNLWYNGKGNQLLSNQIDSFSISGLNRRGMGDLTIYDNAATVNVGIKYQDRTYAASKEVYFRNNIEDIATEDPTELSNNYDPYSVDGAPISIANVDDPDQDVETVLRYKKVDLSALYNMVYDVKLSTDAAGIFTLDHTADTQISTAFKNAHSSTTFEHWTLSVNDVYTSNLSAPPVSGANYYVEGKDPKGNVKKVLLKLEPVSVVQSAGVFSNHSDGGYIEKNGYPTPIEVKGISINDAIIAGKSVTYTAVIKSNGTSKFTYTDRNVPSINAGYAKEYTNNGSFQNYPDGMNNDGFPICICPDPISGGFELSTKNGEDNGNAANNHHYQFLADANKKNELFITFKVNGTALNEVRFYVTFIGMSLEKYN